MSALNLINNENLFLIILGLIWIIGAVIQDLKKREVDNLWNFSLIAFALAYRAFTSIWMLDHRFFLNGLIGFFIFLALGNLFYYSRLFAGGDAKLLMALGAVLPLSFSWINNVKILGFFILLFMITGSIYALIWSMALVFKNKKKFFKEFSKQWQLFKKAVLITLVFCVLWIIFILIIDVLEFVFIGIVVLLFPLLFMFAKAVEESCMVKMVNYDKVTLGDWLYKDIKIGKKKIRANWEGISESELELIKKARKKVLIKYGVPFTPAFLFAFLVLLGIAWIYSWI